jgi:hypothetical protein
MNRNQKIALGCGGAGCLGLIVVAIAGGLIYYFARSPRSTRDYNFNTTTNRNSNSNDNSDFSANSNDNDNSSNSNSSSSSDSTISTDEKHRLYHAAGMTGDSELIQRVSVKIGLMNEDFTPGDKYQAFVEEHASWIIRNFDFIQSVNTPEKARAYVNDHFPQ